VVLAGISLDTAAAVDYARYLSNFAGIVLALGETGKTAQVYFHQECRHLDVPTGLCGVHGTEDQPRVCVQYVDYTCDYRHVMTRDLHPDHPLMDAARMGWFADRLEYDHDGKVVAWPDRREVVEAFTDLPFERRPLREIVTPAPTEGWQPVAVASGPGTPGPESASPCDTCAAWCCSVLVFPKGRPEDASHVDFMRFVLGFPSLTVGVSDDGWAVIVRTRCRHLEGHRCGVYGSAERPQRCSSYDANHCTYRGHFGTPRPPDMVEVPAGRFDVLAASVAFDRFGRVMATAPAAVVRELLEQVG